MLPGGLVVGSGKLGTPCFRMHCAVATSCSFCCSEACVGGPPPGNSFLQMARAASTAGEAGLTPVPAMLIPPLPVGSGKLGTPWLRMHLEKGRNVVVLAEAVEMWPDEPQPAIATMHTPAVRRMSARIGSQHGLPRAG